jgi:hypothetical protein
MVNYDITRFRLKTLSLSHSNETEPWIMPLYGPLAGASYLVASAKRERLQASRSLSLRRKILSPAEVISAMGMDLAYIFGSKKASSIFTTLTGI